jgi:hypothetical protein
MVSSGLHLVFPVKKATSSAEFNLFDSRQLMSYFGKSGMSYFCKVNNWFHYE